MVSMTYGKLPKREDFYAAFAREVRGIYYRIALSKSDSKVLGPHFGDGDYTVDELWVEIQRVMEDPLITESYRSGTPEIERGDKMLDFISSIMHTLGFEWV